MGRGLPAAGADTRAMAAARPAAKAHPAVVRVIAAERNGVRSYGSGVLVATSDEHGLVVTNWHVVFEATGPITVVFADGFRSGATVLRTDRDWDLAALAIWRPAVEPIPLAAVAPRRGEPLTIAGYGSDGRYRAVTGRCTQYNPPNLRLPAELVELSATARQGDSGGPILNSRGELAGVLFGSGRGYTMGSYCGRVREFLGTITDDFRRMPDDGTMIARRLPPAPQQRAAPAPVATIPAQRRLPSPVAGAPPSRGTGDAGWSPARPPSPSCAGTSPAARAQAAATREPGAGSPSGTAETGPLGWKDIAGSTLGEQLKTLLAAVGVLALFVQGLRLLGSGEKS